MKDYFYPRYDYLDIIYNKFTEVMYNFYIY